METLALLFTDIEGSTALLTRLGDLSYATVLEDHHRIIRSNLEAFGGVEQGTHGDSFFAIFTSPSACVAAALEMQRGLRAHPWPAGEEPRVRMGIHTGEASEASTGMVGYEVHRAARIATVGYGGQVLVSSSTMALVQDSLPPGAALLDLGPHRLKDLGRPEVIYQLTADGLDGQFPPLRSLGSPEMPSNLSIQLTSFVGRDAEVRDIAAALRDHRILTITGSGGVGKTRLAVHVAAELLATSPDGVWIAELALVEDGDGMAEVIARSVGTSKRADASLTESILEFLRTKRLLVVLDNCEHLIDEVAALVVPMPRYPDPCHQPRGARCCRGAGLAPALARHAGADRFGRGAGLERGGPAAGRQGYRGGTRLHIVGCHRAGDRRDLSATRRDPSSDRAGGGPDGRHAAERGGGAPRRAVPATHRWASSGR